MTIFSTFVVGLSLLNEVLGGTPQRGVGLAFKNCTDAVVLDVSWYYTYESFFIAKTFHIANELYCTFVKSSK